MISLTFKHEKLKELLKVAKTRWPLEVRTLYEEETGPGFWLVGDQGVYIMHNGKTVRRKTQPIVYAEECNPLAMDFEAWWANKNATFGGDDGAEFIERDFIEQAVEAGSDIVIEFSPGEMKLTLPDLIQVQFVPPK